MNPSEIIKICDEYNIVNYFIKNNLVNVIGDVDISYRNLDEIPLNFGYINGGFNCSHNNLKTLKGAPKYIKGYFNCSHNDLETLEFFPDCKGYIHINNPCYGETSNMTSKQIRLHYKLKDILK